MRAWHNGCALGFRPSIGLPIQLCGFDSRRPLQRLTMAKKIYSIPLQKSLKELANIKSKLNRLSKDNLYLELHSLRGKAYYFLEIEKFINFFKINKDETYSIKTIEYFNSKIFIEILSKHFNFSQYKIKEDNLKPFFYAFCSLFESFDKDSFSNLFFKLFLHYHSQVNNSSNIEIDFKSISQALAKSRGLTIKESYKEIENQVFFNLLLNQKVAVSLKGKSIKTLRKKAYKKLFFQEFV